MTGRRRFLRAVAAATGAAVAGCSGGSGDETDDGNGSPAAAAESNDPIPSSTARTGTGGTTDADGAAFPDLSAGDPTYRRWLPAEGDTRLGVWGASNLARARARRDRLPASDYESAIGFVTTGDYFGVDFADLDAFLSPLSGPGTIYPGEFDRSAIDGTLTATGYEQFDTQGNVTFYRETGAEQPARVAVADQGVIEDPYGTPESFRDRSVALFETAAGDRQRRHEADERVRRYTDAVGFPLGVASLEPPGSSGGMAGVSIQLPDGVRQSAAVGRTEHVTDEATVDRTWLYVVADDRSPADVLSTLEGGDYSVGDAEVAFRRDGRVVEAAVVRPIGNPGGGADPPLLTLDAAITDGELILTHRAGDTLALDRVTVRIGAETYGVEGSLAPGNSTTVDGLPADPDDDVLVIYESPAGASSTTIARVAAD